MKGLKHEADGAAAQQRDGVVVQSREIHAVEQHAAGVGAIEAGQQIEQRRFADAGFAHDGEILALPQFEVRGPRRAPGDPAR